MIYWHPMYWPPFMWMVMLNDSMYRANSVVDQTPSQALLDRQARIDAAMERAPKRRPNLRLVVDR